MALTKTLQVVGPQTMICRGCERAVTMTIAQLPSVTNASADHKTQLIKITVSDEQFDFATIKEELDWIGYATILL